MSRSMANGKFPIPNKKNLINEPRSFPFAVATAPDLPVLRPPWPASYIYRLR